ncbi:hypothetical protein QE152_g30399 [Popillia japonica]|uniref:Uncharacterized protein n=1 Tax=Popillia japonica TaxID=7064 RepID=A0AAW1JF34_POPJA
MKFLETWLQSPGDAGQAAHMQIVHPCLIYSATVKKALIRKPTHKTTKIHADSPSMFNLLRYGEKQAESVRDENDASVLRDWNPGDHIIVLYDGNHSPGQITGVHNGRVSVNAMVESTERKWTWPKLKYFKRAYTTVGSPLMQW